MVKIEIGDRDNETFWNAVKNADTVPMAIGLMTLFHAESDGYDEIPYRMIDSKDAEVLHEYVTSLPGWNNDTAPVLFDAPDVSIPISVQNPPSVPNPPSEAPITQDEEKEQDD